MSTNNGFFNFKKYPIALVILAFILTACGGGGSASDNSLALSGIVLDSYNIPVANAEIVIDPNTTPVASAAVTVHRDRVVAHTDSHGAFHCRVPPGRHHINAKREGRVFLDKDFDAHKDVGHDSHDLGELHPWINNKPVNYDVAVTLSGIAISPATATVQQGQNAAYTAISTYSDATTADLTSQVAWSSADPTVATIDASTGIAAGVGVGSTSVSASFASSSVVIAPASITVAPTAPPAPAAAVVTVSATSPKTLSFNWTAVSGATSYKLLKSADGLIAYSQVGGNLADTATQATDVIGVHLQDWVNERYIVQACNASGCTNSSPVSTTSAMIAVIGYVKAGNTEASGQFGYSVALSADGYTMAVGAYGETSDSTGINSTPNPGAFYGAGAVYVFSLSGTTWTQQAYVKASNTGDGDKFGYSVSLSKDGNTLAVGATNQAGSGAVYVYSRTGTSWTEQAYVKASNAGGGDQFGDSVALSADGNTLAVGAKFEDSGTSGINTTPDELATNAGAVYVYSRSVATWTEQAYVKASNAGAGDAFGYAVALSADGNTLAVGANAEDSSTSGINTTPDEGQLNSGAVYVFSRNVAIWTQQAYVKAGNTGASDAFGYSVALSADGNTLAVGANAEDSGTSGINTSPNELQLDSGAVYVFSRSSATWTQQAYVKASNTGAGDKFGSSVALSADGSTLAVGAPYEDSSTIGINTMPADLNANVNAGAVYVYSLSGTTWSEKSYVKASNTKAGDLFGYSVALSTDGTTMVVGANNEDSIATGIGGDQTDVSASNAGAVYLY